MHSKDIKKVIYSFKHNKYIQKYTEVINTLSLSTQGLYCLVTLWEAEFNLALTDKACLRYNLQHMPEISLIAEYDWSDRQPYNWFQDKTS